ncbi:hypothetical protein NW762_010064 [Fusarium torreyae]|uniref:Uncharacterized protein n=1 Tax=Fusarium torreyae TaxID=1237075 RepID=A0A9W8RU05_9HYPO|nr:hypothetical protein NW762_010064 [Fusarium torreyae]
MAPGQRDHSETEHDTEAIELQLAPSAQDKDGDPAVKPNIDDIVDAPANLEQTPKQPEDESCSNEEATSQRGRPVAGRDSSSKSTSLESDVAFNARGHSDDGANEGALDLSVGDKYVLLDQLRDQALFKFGAGGAGEPPTEQFSIYNFGLRTMPIMLGSGRIVNLSWSSNPGTEADENAVQVSDDIRRAWPHSLNGVWMPQKIVSNKM